MTTYTISGKIFLVIKKQQNKIKVIAAKRDKFVHTKRYSFYSRINYRNCGIINLFPDNNYNEKES